MTTGEPNWDDIRIFLAVARTGSLTEAGRRLGLSQPTIGRHLRSLEEVARARLFDR
ncbi:helix-turn-helix domain-containing protein, partial [Inquilinus limosus]